MSEPPPGAVLMTNSTGRVGCCAAAAAPPAVPPPAGAGGVQPIASVTRTAHALSSRSSRRCARTPPHIVETSVAGYAPHWRTAGVGPSRGLTSYSIDVRRAARGRQLCGNSPPNCERVHSAAERRGSTVRPCTAPPPSIAATPTLLLSRSSIPRSCAASRRCWQPPCGCGRRSSRYRRAASARLRWRGSAILETKPSGTRAAASAAGSRPETSAPSGPSSTP